MKIEMYKYSLILGIEYIEENNMQNNVDMLKSSIGYKKKLRKSMRF